jgi:TetR/AcrR family fatty acid metabolism transcriptional regulator
MPSTTSRSRATTAPSQSGEGSEGAVEEHRSTDSGADAVAAAATNSGAASGGVQAAGKPERRRDLRDKRLIILDAAIKVFADRGYHGSRVSDIAAEAGIAYGLVYHYFKNKEEILDTIFRERWSGFLEAIEAIAAGPSSTEDKLLSVAALILNAYRVRADWVKVLVFEIQRSSRFAEPSQIRAVGRFFQLIERLVREGQESGELRSEIDPEVASYVFVGALELVITARVLDVLRVEAEAEAGQSELFN